MGKFPFKRPRIISKKFPELDSSIEGVTKSLNDLVFSYHEQVQNALSKKHWMMAFSSITLLLVLGSFISMRGKADSSIFYPDTCLGGWANPQNAQGEPQTTSNGDESQFTKANSAILPENTNAEMYCGNFKGKFDAATRPTKIIVSLALTKGVDHPDEELAPVPVVATTTEVVIDVASSTASTTLLLDSQTEVSTSTTEANSQASTSDTIETAIATPGKAKDEGPSVVEGIVKSVQDTIHDLFNTKEEESTQTDTVVIPPPAPAETTPTEQPVTPEQPEAAPAESPTSYLPQKNYFLSHFVETVFAQEEAPVPVVPDPVAPEVTTTATTEEKSVENTVDSETSIEEVKKEETVTEEEPEQSSSTPTVLGVSTSTEDISGTSTTELGAMSSSTASSTEFLLSASTTQETASTTEDTESQNNFLEVFYTFDGKIWQSLGVLNEISMKYRTFEIPVTASTTWTDMSQLQIKIEARKHHEDTPMVYLDGVKVEVLYESTLEHAHPDFKRDTILKDEVVDGMRIVTIINNDNNREEVWYMYLEDEVATSTLEMASSTLLLSTSTEVASTSDSALFVPDTSNDVTSSSTEIASSTATSSVPFIKPVVQKNTWLKFDGKVNGISGHELYIEIKKLDEERLDPKERSRTPDFTLDTIKRIKGTFLQAVVVQVQKENTDELWLYNIENDTQEKLETGSTTSVSATYPLGVKGGYLFWLSQDESKVYAYDLLVKSVMQSAVPLFDGGKGERAEIVFEQIPWKVIIGSEDFSFYSEATGEVFSDDNATVSEAFRRKLHLDQILDVEELGELNFPVEETTVSPADATQ